MRSWSARAIACALVVGCFAAVTSAPVPALAAEKTALVPAVLIVDVQQVLRGSKAGKGVQEKLSQESQAFSKEAARQEDELQRMNADLQRQRTVLSPAALDAKAKTLQTRVKEYDASVQAKRAALQKALFDAQQKIEVAARDIIVALAKERGANLVVVKQAVVYNADDGADVTEEVLARLDKKLVSVAVSLPKTESVAPRKREKSGKREPSPSLPKEAPAPKLQLEDQ
jgi:outer membrane protein